MPTNSLFHHHDEIAASEMPHAFRIALQSFTIVRSVDR
jgi:hypothetical protein